VAEVDAQPVPSSTSLAGGHLLAAISTSIVGILRDHYGRGPMKAKTYALDDIIVVVMRGSGFTPLEQTIMDSGEPDRVIAMREDFQRVMAAQYRQTIEELTGRTFERAWRSRAHYRRDLAGFSTWLFKIAQNVRLDFLQSRRGHLPIDAALDVAADGTPEKEAERNSDLARLSILTKDLPDRERELIALKYGAGVNNRLRDAGVDFLPARYSVETRRRALARNDFDQILGR